MRIFKIDTKLLMPLFADLEYYCNFAFGNSTVI